MKSKMKRIFIARLFCSNDRISIVSKVKICKSFIRFFFSWKSNPQSYSKRRFYIILVKKCLKFLIPQILKEKLLSHEVKMLHFLLLLQIICLIIRFRLLISRILVMFMLWNSSLNRHFRLQLIFLILLLSLLRNLELLFSLFLLVLKSLEKSDLLVLGV